MQTVTLYIETPGGQQVVRLDQEISIGRTNLAQLVVNDPSLSRLHATIFREGEEVWILDENSSNGTFVGGERVSPERKLRDRDEILLGSNTRIYVEINQSFGQTQPKPAAKHAASPIAAAKSPQIPTPPGAPKKPSLPLIPIIAGAFAFFVIIFAAIALFLVSRSGSDSPGNSKPGATTQVSFDKTIPLRVIDPLGGEDPDDLDDFLSSWEGEEEALKAENIEEIKEASSTTGDAKPRTDLIVTREFWQQQMNKALARPGANVGLSVPAEMSGRGFGLQLRKVAQLRDRGYKVPLDFADLAELRLKGVLVELPIATQTFVLDVGGSATGDEFTEFDFDRGNLPLTPGSEKYNYLKRLADNFEGQKYDLNNPQHRKQIRMRLLRMYNAQSRKLLEEICNAYYQRFKAPLRITSLTRSMDYQISLNRTNGNSYRVRDRNALPPHTSGCAFDVGRNHLTGEAQNFLMEILSGHERNGKLDTLIEGNVNACFHTFIYPDGVGPNQTTVATQPKPSTSPPTQKPKSGK